MDIGDILYFLFIIVGVVYSIFKKANGSSKKSPRDSKRDNNRSATKARSVVDELLREFGGEEFTEQRSAPTEKREPQQEERENYTTEEAEEQNFLNYELEHSKSYSEKEKELLGKEIDEESPIFGNQPRKKARKSEFDLKKAVIYSAIMNRPEY